MFDFPQRRRISSERTLCSERGGFHAEVLVVFADSARLAGLGVCARARMLGARCPRIVLRLVKACWLRQLFVRSAVAGC